MTIQRIASTLNSKPHLRVAAYVRVSSDLENQDESYEGQSQYYRNRIMANPEWECAGIYAERLSGTHAENRPEFNRMLSDAEAGKIDLILCKSVSRWARNTVDALESLQQLASHNVHVIFEEQGIDTRNPGILLQLSFAAAIAQNESRSISENMKWTYRNKARQGIFTAHRDAYFGYDTTDGRFQPNQDAPVVRQIFRLYAGGMNFRDILSAVGPVKDQKGRELNTKRIRRILENEIYVGDKEFGKYQSKDIITGEVDEGVVKRYVRDHHEGLVDRETWNAVQRRREGNCRKSTAERRLAPQN